MAKENDLPAETEVPVIQADQEGIILHVNEAFLRTYLWNRERLIGALITEIMPEKFREAHNLGYSRFLTSRQPRLLDHELLLEVRCGNGEDRPAIHVISVQGKGDEMLLSAQIIPTR